MGDSIKGGQTLPQLARLEHVIDAFAKRVLAAGFDGADYQDLAMSPDGDVKTAAAVETTSALSNVNTTYNDSTTSANSETIDCSKYRWFQLFASMDSSGVGTHQLLTKVQFSQDGGTTWFDYRNNFWGQLYVDDVEVVGGVNRCWKGECIAEDMRVRVEATNTNASLTFQLTNMRLAFKT